MGFIDAYTIRARLFPAILAIAPAIAFATIAVAWTVFGLSQAITTGAIAVLFVGAADIGRRFGKRAERKLFSDTGGRPTLTLLRHDRSEMDTRTKDRYRNFLGHVLGETPPSPEDEISHIREVAGFYERCGNWLREMTRDHQKYEILFDENKTCGFRRNLFGLKWPSLALNLFVVITCIVLLFGYKVSLTEVSSAAVMVVLTFSVIHAAFFLFGVTRGSVLQASEQYERQLILSCETLMQERKYSPA